MGIGRAGGKRWYAAAACAAALVAALAGAVTLGSGGTGTPGRAATGKGVLTIRSALNVFYLPRFGPPDGAPLAPEYTVDLEASAARPGGGPGAVRKVRLSFDLSAFRGRAEIYGVHRGYGCVRHGFRVDCSPGDIGFGEGAVFLPFSVKPLPDTAPGPAGTVSMTVRSADAPTLHHTTRVIVGSPFLTARRYDRPVTGVRPGGEVRLTPGFGNKGDTGVDGGVTLLLSATEATLPLRYANCRYDRPRWATRAQCDLPGPFPAGSAYETDRPVVAVTDRTAKEGSVGFGIQRTVDLDPLDRLPASAPRGTGARLGLRPVDGSDFTADNVFRSKGAGGALKFGTTTKNDVEAVGFTIKGRVGQVVDVPVPYPRGAGWTWKPGYAKLQVTLPEGVDLVTVPPESHSSDFLYCYPGAHAPDPVVCPGPEAGGTLMRVRIDRRVDGARGSVTVPSDPAEDPDRDDNTAPVRVEYVE
ncbi:hypothetical protein [Streptomyces tropicalis]|uniref:DUF11 domain-containing protein n=1 Tax=Streptomyces tropicalis TaxID=3034234 RepID=A0ABT5ZYA8_9ACTN|nr:hypothetical protein [Streptomyces tropicalis]MDF3297374.1 hypothetical protein [Streptomyces tropicalis]